MSYIVSPNAESELDAAWIYIARESGDAEIATRFIEAFYGYFGLLDRHQRLGRVREDIAGGVRSMPAQGYVIFYSILDDNDILILNVIHGSRDLGSVRTWRPQKPN